LYDGRIGSRTTGKERDQESGNDYFKYRYLASSMGRWLSPDPSGLTHINLGNPQELNLYNYVGNNPLTRADLDGLCWKGFQWACDLGNGIKNLAIDAKNKIEFGEWTTDTKQAEIRKLDRDEARTRASSYWKETHHGCGATSNIGYTFGFAGDIGFMHQGESMTSTRSGQASISLVGYSEGGDFEGAVLSLTTGSVSYQQGGDYGGSPAQDPPPSVYGAYGGFGYGVTWGTNYGAYTSGASQSNTINTPIGSASGSESASGTQASATLGPGLIGSVNNVTTYTRVLLATGPCQ